MKRTILSKTSSWTQQQTARLKCPKRYFYRYLDPAKAGEPYRQLYSVRELGGLLIHEALAGVVRRVADGGRVSDEKGVAEEARSRFLEIVAHSLATLPRELSGGRQLAETFNGVTPDDDIRHWKDYIPECINNGLRLMITLGFRSNSGNYMLEVERRYSFNRSGRTYRGVMDVYIQDDRDRIIIDWKTHEITSTDLQQLDHYIRHIERKEGIPASRITGIAVDLAREKPIPRRLKPEGLLIGARDKYGKSEPSQNPPENDDPHLSKPSIAACEICPFTAICKDSAVFLTGMGTEVSL
jgi:hypothetical protein